MTISAIQSADRAIPPVQLAPAKSVEDPSATSTTVSALQQAYYYSPALAIDPKTGSVVVEIRNSSTGAVINQYPSEKDLKAYADRSLKQTGTSTDAAVTPAVPAAPAKGSAPADTSDNTRDETTPQASSTSVIA